MKVESHKIEDVPEDFWVFKVKEQDLYGHPHYEDGKLAGIQIGMGIVGSLCLSKEEWEKGFPDIIKSPDAELVRMRDELKRLKEDDKG